MTESSHHLLQYCQRMGSVAVDLKADSRRVVTSLPALALAMWFGVLVERGLRNGEAAAQFPRRVIRSLLNALPLITFWQTVRKATRLEEKTNSVT